MLPRVIILSLLFLCILMRISRAELLSCPSNYTEDITDGKQFVNGTIIKNNVQYPNGTYYYYYDDNNNKKKIKGCLCKVKNCVRKCCPDGQLLTNDTCVIDMNLPNLRIDVYDKDKFIDKLNISNFYIIHGGGCPNFNMKKFKLEPFDMSEDLYYVQMNGQLHLPNDIDVNDRYLDVDNYCLDIERRNFNNYDNVVYRCIEEDYYTSGEFIALTGNVLGKYSFFVFNH